MTMKESGFVRKKLVNRAVEAKPDLQAKLIDVVGTMRACIVAHQLPTHHMWFHHLVTKNDRDTNRKYGYVPKGATASHA